MTNKPSPEELSLRNKMRIIRTQQLRISIKDDFATHAKLQRQLIKLEDELKETIQERLEKNVKLKLTIQYGFNIVANILLIFSIIYSRHIPLIVLKHDLYPFESLFGYASGVPHAVTSHAWVIMTRVSIDVIMKATVKISEFKQQNSEPSSPTVS